MSDAHEDIIELLGAYALDAVDGDELVAVEDHLAECPRCTAEVADHREVAAMLAHTGAPAPEGLWGRIVESLEEPPPALMLPLRGPETAPALAPVVPLRRHSPWFPAGAAAAAAVLIIGLVAGVFATRPSPGPVDRAETAAPSLDDVARRVLNDPDAARIELVSADGTMAAAAAIDGDGDGYLLASGLPALPDAETYQLWAVGDGAVVSIGVLGHSPGVVAFHVDEGVRQLVITREVAGGVPSSSNPALLAGEVS